MLGDTVIYYRCKVYGTVAAYGAERMAGSGVVL